MDKKEQAIEAVSKVIKVAIENNDWQQINDNMTHKRVGWYENNKKELNFEGSDLKKAYFVLFTKLGVDFSEVPIVYEDEKKIVWHSYNWCPVLESCKRNNWDTKEVCKCGYADSVNALVQKVNPKLKFDRSYTKIRPYFDYCEEWIELKE